MITIYEKTHMASCVDKLDSFERETYIAHIGEYFDFLVEDAEAEGLEIEFKDSEAMTSYHADTEQEIEFMQSVASFWQWLNL